MTNQRTKPHVVLTGGRKPSFPIKSVWFRTGVSHTEGVSSVPIDTWQWEHDKKRWDIIAVERAE